MMTKMSGKTYTAIVREDIVFDLIYYSHMKGQMIVKMIKKIIVIFTLPAICASTEIL